MPFCPVAPGEQHLLRIQPISDSVLDHFRPGIVAGDQFEMGDPELAAGLPGATQHAAYSQLGTPGLSDRVEMWTERLG